MSSNVPHEELERRAATEKAASPLREMLAREEKARLARVALEDRAVVLTLPDFYVIEDRRLTMSYANAKMLEFELLSVLLRLDKSAT